MEKKGGRKKLKQSDMRKNFCVRFNDKEFGQGLCKAAMYLEGNFSAWVRFATIHCVPSMEDLKEFKALNATKKKSRSKVNKNLLINKLRKRDLGRWQGETKPLAIDVLKNKIFQN